MSTILDALRKAQDDTATGTREVPIEQIPAPDEAAAPRRARPRRALTWLAGIAAVLALAFVGGLALGNRVSDMLLGDRTQTAKTDAATSPVDAPAADPVAVAEEDRPAVAERSVEPVEEPPARLAAVPVPRDVAPSHAPREPAAVARAADSAAPVAGSAGEEPVPTPYGQLHVFGAAEAPGGGSSAREDRAARLRQLREKMLKARRESAERTGGRAPEAPIAIAVPPSAGTTAAPAAEPAAAGPDPAGELDGSDTPPAVAAEPPAEVAHVAEEPAEVPPPAVPRPAPIGVSVAPEAAATDGEIHDPDIAPFRDEVVDVAAAEPAAEEAAEPAAVAPPVAVASVPPAPPPAAAAPPVLRRSPGGAPQVSINILQWSAEPGRRFAFVSVDGGGMTQVREGDRIAGLTVKHIHQQMIEFGFNDSSFLLRAN